MIKKSFYEAPEAELLLVKFEENIMSNETYTTKQTWSGAEGWEDGTENE